jgi:RNA polymerase sigma-70 factor (ECF subfamily)
MDIENIIHGCRQQDRKCQEALYRQYYAALFALCKSFFSDEHDIVTALNNGMLKVFQNIDQYDMTKGKFFNWVYTTVRYAALTMIRDRKPNLTYELNENMQEASAGNPFAKLEWADIYFYLDQLPSNTRIVCTLYYIEGFSIKEIAASINMKSGTVKWHLNECRTRLKTIFESHKLRNSG